ncbi:hypothetical protein ApDm4_2797 [Acetobacter pomorum]|nr:hypothetical protein ApDm4_2797 [Acetobacter pomorum]
MLGARRAKAVPGYGGHRGKAKGAVKPACRGCCSLYKGQWVAWAGGVKGQDDWVWLFSACYAGGSAG